MNTKKLRHKTYRFAVLIMCFYLLFFPEGCSQDVAHENVGEIHTDSNTIERKSLESSIQDNDNSENNSLEIEIRKYKPGSHCSPCENDSDCKEAGAHCLPHPKYPKTKRKYCGRRCCLDKYCLSGYKCKKLDPNTYKYPYQCIPYNLDCEIPLSQKDLCEINEMNYDESSGTCLRQCQGHGTCASTSTVGTCEKDRDCSYPFAKCLKGECHVLLNCCKGKCQLPCRDNNDCKHGTCKLGCCELWSACYDNSNCPSNSNCDSSICRCK